MAAPWWCADDHPPHIIRLLLLGGLLMPAARALPQEGESEPVMLEPDALRMESGASGDRSRRRRSLANEKMAKPITLVMRDRTLRGITLVPYEQTRRYRTRLQ